MNCKVVLARATGMLFIATLAAFCLLLTFAHAGLDAGSAWEENSDLVLGTKSEPLSIEYSSALTLHLPLILTAAPDLIVTSLTATNTGVWMVIENQGYGTVAAPFWVDAYVDPITVPTEVNQTWQMLADQGMVWGIEDRLGPADVVTLTLGDRFYWGSESRVSWPLPEGTQVYAQVDSYHPHNTYGAILESHEILGTEYNNILGPAVVPVVTAK